MPVGAINLPNGAKRGILVLAFLPLFWVLLWMTGLSSVSGATFIYVLGAQVAIVAVIGKLSFRLWPDSNRVTLSRSLNRLAPVAAWVSIYFLVSTGILALSEMWKYAEYISMPIPAIVLFEAVRRRRRHRRIYPKGCPSKGYGYCYWCG